ncbi:hypothetical protein [Candidatus Nitrospira nitrificans]|uniref:Uncharacterized protein n=1 Tax=Candidatus Nitrospira nitrificans TaxID=1742973 RepID=A0A0S4LSL6_9BACT|nr:hypothetical protein [Candidatus Nitrospira nitrificans]CUS39977.1 exported hypothetical protein [Candidatus Nitrospira nitrificans]
MNPSRTLNGVKRLGVTVLLGGLFVGCAVLTVDVDVYKGALVNEEEVQLHQLVALATAAKPMLLQLRDILEWPHTNGMPYAEDKDKDNDKDTIKKCVDRDKRVKSWYRSQYVSSAEDYIPEVEPQPALQKIWKWITEVREGPPPTCQAHFENPYARSVNIILSLYEDVDSPDFDPYGRKLREAVEQLRRAAKIYDLNKERDQKIFASISKGLKQKKDLDTTPLLQDLLEAYEKDLLVPPAETPGDPIRRVGRLMDAFQKLAQAGQESDGGKAKYKFKSGIEPDLIDQWKGSQFYKQNAKDQLYDQKLPFRAVWKLLGEGNEDTQLTKETRKLCVDGTRGEEACRQLNERTKELADAYWDVRQATRELWEEGLGLLVRIERLEREETGRYHALKEKVIQLVMKITNPRLIASALARLSDNGTCSVLEDTLLREWKRLCDGDSKGIAWTTENVTKNSAHFETILKQALSSTPSDTALFLLTLDSLEKHAAPKNSVAQKLIEGINTANPKRIVRLGLLNSFIEGSEVSGPGSVFQVVEEVNRDLANGFGRGRLSDGLHTLTERYLQLHNGAGNGADINEQKQLLESLVEFAQKILFLANHEGLASPPGSDGLIVGGGKGILRGLLGDEFMDGYEKSTLFGQPHVPKAMTRRYVRVLQAIGNSILFSANELRERDRYREQGQKKVVAEVTAAKSIYSPDPAKVLTDLLTELEHDKQAAQTVLDDANARKPTVAEQRRRLAEQQNTATHKLDAIKIKIANYKDQFTPVETMHQVLLYHVNEVVKVGWKTDWGDQQSTLDKFLASDSESLENKLTAARNLTTSPEIEKRDKFDTAISYVKSQDALNDFTKYRTPKGTTPEKRSTLLDEFITHIQSLEDKRRKQIADYKNEQDAHAGELRSIEEKIAALTAEADQISKLPDKIAQLETARTEIASVQADVLKDADSFKKANESTHFVSPETIYSLIRSLLEKQHTESSRTAQTVLSSYMPPPAMPPLDPKDYKSPREVMDAVIALLRHRQMEVLERFGKDSPEEKKATEALENAYRHRAGMIYIRPSSAYLRTSFPSTSLQEDPNLAWDNMLLKQGLRNLPFSSELRDILNPAVKQDQVLTSDLDKQYWQNINRVRVSGAGLTNQALVKDDVGNWYVKQYYGNTEQIWKSAKNLALFSLGTKVPIDLAKKLQNASSPEEYSENSKDSPTLQKVLEKHQDAYATHTNEIQAKLERLHTKDKKSELQASIIAAWDAVDGIKKDSGFYTSLHKALEAEILEWDKSASALKDKADQDRGQAIIKDVRALSRLEKMLSARIKEINPPDASAQAIKDAVSAVHRIVGEQVMDILADRNRALDRYEQAIMFIGDAANPKDPNAK